MVSYPPPNPTENTVFNPNDFLQTEEAAAAGVGVYVKKTGDTMTGTLTLPTLVCTGTISTNILDATTTIDGDIITLNQTGAARTNSLATYGLTINPRSSASSGNALVSANDHALLFTNGTNDTGALTIGPFTASSMGMRMDGTTGNTTFQNGLITNSYLNVPNNTNPIIIGASGSNARTIIRSNNTTGGDIFIDVPTDCPNGSNFLMTAGAATVTGVKSFSTQPKFTAASNQLAIQPSGSGTQININAANPASTRTYTLPDAGAAANFILSEGANVWTSTARFDVPNQRITLGSSGTHSQKCYIYASSGSGNKLVIGESSSESRGMISTNLSNSGTYGINSDIGDPTRMFGLTNSYTTNQAASRGCAINFQNLGSGGSNTGRTYNDLFVNREIANQSTAAWYFNGFDPTFANYYTSHRLGYQLYSFIGGQGNAGVVLNSNVNPTGIFMMGSTTPKVVIGDGSTESTGSTFITGGLHCGGQFDIQKLNWRIPIYKFNAVTSGGAKTYAIFSPEFTSSSVNFMIYVSFNLMVEILDPTRIQANNNMSSCMVTYAGTYYYNPSSSTQGLVDQNAVKQTDINVGINRTITTGSVTITNSGTIFSPVFNLNITLGGASIASSNISIAGDVMMDINSTSGYMTGYS